MLRGNLIVCETRGRWARWLRPHLPGADCALCEARSLGDAWQQLTAKSQSVLAVEMTGTNLDRVAKLLVDAGRRFASVPVIVLTTRHLVRYQWLLRELGAQYVASSAAHIHDVVGIVNRYVVSLPTTESNRPLAATIRDRLPWREPRERRSPGRE